MEQNFNQPQIPLPNASAVMVLGILSIPACCCTGIGLVLAIIALVLEKTANSQYLAEPGKYTEGSYSNLNTGKICAWIGLGLSIVSIIMTIIYYVFLVSNPDFQQIIQDAMKQA